MNCIGENCKHVRCRDIPCNIRISKDVVCHSIVDCYCELGHTCHVPFTDKGDRLHCDDYERRELSKSYV